MKNEVTVQLVDHQVQKRETTTCGRFQLYDYVNLFNPVKNSQLITDKSLTKKSIGKPSDGIFTTEENEIESRIEVFIDEIRIQITMGE